MSHILYICCTVVYYVFKISNISLKLNNAAINLLYLIYCAFNLVINIELYFIIHI